MEYSVKYVLDCPGLERGCQDDPEFEVQDHHPQRAPKVEGATTAGMKMCKDGKEAYISEKKIIQTSRDVYRFEVILSDTDKVVCSPWPVSPPGLIFLGVRLSHLPRSLIWAEDISLTK